MSMELSASEVLSIAERIERNGAKFYRRAAGRVDDADLSTLLVNLAQWESRHLEAFGRIRERLSDEGSQAGAVAPEQVDPRSSAVMAGLAVFGLKSDSTEELPSRPTKADVLRLAIGKERDSIVYYLGLRDFMTVADDKKVIEEIIDEEKKHVRILMQMLEQAR